MEKNKEPVPENLAEGANLEAEARRKRAWRWQIFGWSVIGLMIAAIVLNLLNVLTPEINKYLLGVIIGAYAVYIFLRRR